MRSSKQEWGVRKVEGGGDTATIVSAEGACCEGQFGKRELGGDGQGDGRRHEEEKQQEPCAAGRVGRSELAIGHEGP